MTPLTQTAYYSRIGIKVGIVGLIVMIVGRVVVDTSVKWWKLMHPAKPAAPTMGYGILPELSFPIKDKVDLTYTLETPTGKLPNFVDRLPVYLMPVERPNLLALEKAKKMAKELGFDNEPTKLSDVQYRWTNQTPFPSQLKQYIYNGSFTLDVDWSSDPAFLQNRQLPSEPDSVTEARNYLTTANLSIKDLESGSYSINYLKASGRDYLETISLSEADFIRVNLFRSQVDSKYPVVTPDPDKGIVQIVFSGNDLSKVVNVEYNYFPVEYNTFETYPLKSAIDAWNELQQGNGYIASYNNKVSAITIRRMELGYFDTYQAQKYFQPVYIFKGDNDFIAYVTAVQNPELVKTKSK